MSVGRRRASGQQLGGITALLWRLGMLHRLKIPYKRCRLNFKRTRVCPHGNSRGEVGPFQWRVGGWMAAMSDAPPVDERQGASQGLIRQTMTTRCCPCKTVLKRRGVCASVCTRSHPTLIPSFCFRKSDPAAIQMVVPVGLAMALKPPEESWYIRAANRADDSAGRPPPFDSTI